MKLANAPARKLQRQIIATNRVPTGEEKHTRMLPMTDTHLQAIAQTRTVRTKKRRASV